MRILTEPKNALVKQYVKLFGYDDVELVVNEDALRAIAKRAIDQKTGARGLRAIMEDILLQSMFDAPSDQRVSRVEVTRECVENRTQPVLHTRRSRKLQKSED